MRPSTYWLSIPSPWRLAIMPRPRAGDWLDDEIAGWKAEGIDVVVSLLEPDEITELDLHRLPMLCRGADIEFVAFPIPDRGVPASMRETDRLVRRVWDAVAAGKAVAIHCRAGIGRSAVIEAGRGGEVRYWGEIDTTEAATRKLVARLAAKYGQLTFCYEAGPRTKVRGALG